MMVHAEHKDTADYNYVTTHPLAVAEILGGAGGALAPPLFEEGGQCPPTFFKD